jgi:hypothetical protein
MGKYIKGMLVVGLILGVVILLAGLFSTSPPKPKVSIEGELFSIPTTQGSYCWEGLLSSQCMDTVEPSKLVEDRAVIVPPGAKILINFRKEPNPRSLGTLLWTASDSEVAQLNGNTLTVPETPGTYIYSIHATWDRGSGSYAFKVKVQ